MPSRILPPDAELIALRDQGLTIRAIGELFGVGSSTVGMALRRAGVPRLEPVPVERRFWSKVDRDGPVPDYALHLGPCWLWTAAQDSHGYGNFFRGPTRADGYIKAYRMAYELEVGPVPDDKQLDHLCRVPLCVRPSHLEPVDQRTNILRGVSTGARNAVATHCIRGHAFDEANTIVRPNGRRNCRACLAVYAARPYGKRAKRAAAARARKVEQA